MVTGTSARAILIQSFIAPTATLSAAIAFTGLLLATPAQAESPLLESRSLAKQENNQGNNQTGIDVVVDFVADGHSDNRPLAQDSSILSLVGAERLMEEATDAVADEDYDLAVEKYKSARQVYNQLSNFYQDLAASFSGVDTLISSGHRDRALETAQQRDLATYRLALVHRAQDTPDLAVPLLIQIIRSQQPTRDLGEDAYRQLYELGFVDSPYPDSPDSEPISRN